MHREGDYWFNDKAELIGTFSYMGRPLGGWGGSYNGRTLDGRHIESGAATSPRIRSRVLVNAAVLAIATFARQLEELA